MLRIIAPGGAVERIGSGWPDYFKVDFAGGQGYFGSSAGPSDQWVSGGTYHTQNWSIDLNHPNIGQLRLFAYADWPYWERQLADGTYQNTDLTRGRVHARVRGVNFVPNGFKCALHLQARHPDYQDKFVNWTQVGIDRTPLLTDGQVHDLDCCFENGPSTWLFSGGQASLPQYDKYLPYADVVANVRNVHLLGWHPDPNASPPSGAFEISLFEAWCTRNYSTAAAVPPTSPMGATWDPATKAGTVTLSNGTLTAYHAPFGASTGVRDTIDLSDLAAYCESRIDILTDTNDHRVGLCGGAYLPGSAVASNGPNGWQLQLGTGNIKAAGGAAFSWLPPLTQGQLIKQAFKNGKWWIGVVGQPWPNGGDPAAGTNPAVSGITGSVYLCDNNGTSASAFQMTLNPGSSSFVDTVPTGFSGIGA